MRRDSSRVEPQATPDPQSGRWLWVLMVVALLLAGVAFFVGRGFRSPAQVAAQAQAPQPSLVTAPVQRAVPSDPVVIRATLGQGVTATVEAPAALNGSLPVVTALPVHVGSIVEEGSVVLAVAQRPVILLQGPIQAFRTMRPGDAGVDVAELQTALIRLGLASYPDQSGTYGIGTAHAVALLYERLGYAPVTMPVSEPGVGRKGRPLQLATVPLGEVAFISQLPKTVVKVAAHMGIALTPSGSSSSGGGRAPIVLGGELPVLRGYVDSNTATLLHRGQAGTAVSDLSGRSIRVRITSIAAAAAPQSAGAGEPRYLVRLAPASAGADRLIGQSLAVHLQTSHGSRRQWIVPAAAVVTTADGRSHVTVLRGAKQIDVPVRPGLSELGRVVIYPQAGIRLRSGDEVVVGAA